MMRETLQGHLELITQELALDPIAPEIAAACDALLAQLRFASYAPDKSRVDEKALRTAMEALEKAAPAESTDNTSRPGALVRAAKELIASPLIEDYPEAPAPEAKPVAEAKSAPAAKAASTKAPPKEPASEPPNAAPRKPADPASDIAATYDKIGGGARDRSAKAPAVKGAKPASTRSAAPLVTAQDFAKKLVALGAAAEVAPFLPKLEKLPEQMRILTLEALYGAQAVEDVRDIITQTQGMLGA
ncbi:MAG: hypothetical protein IT381_01945 [Deltaproteobacteria bacterium]|nr:hypothetical protein [Deltaproteobacteria bacterium]